MKLHFSGGANEIGASSTSIEIEESRILVDAGIRMKPGQDSQLPDFQFDKVGLPDAVLLTHAHTDHTGALPILHRLLPLAVKVYSTAPTKAITRVLLKDSAGRMGREEQEEGQAPQYTLEDVTAVLDRMKAVGWLEPINICPGVTARWIRAGHILGAAMIYIESKNESILMTGDVSATAQLTVPGVEVPPWCKHPDVMVMESTYGKRPHEVDRCEEEKRLAADIVNTIKEGGKALIPAFAVGRSQEVILILKDAMERKEIPEFPVYVDGMVRKVNEVYSDFAHGLSSTLKRKANRGEDLFYSDAIRKVESPDERESILAGEPCCIVASSGMLNGGISNYYARCLVSDGKNLIAITGYQAEGTPGRALQDLPSPGDDTDPVWFIDDEYYEVKCQVERYSLSAHADRNQLIELVEKVQPRELFLVHGDAEARGELFKSVRATFPVINVRLPENGRGYTVRKQTGIARGRQSRSDRILSEVFAFVQKGGLRGPFRVQYLAEIWFGTEAVTSTVVKFFEWCLSLDGRFFARGSGNLFHLR